jgi:hypothetical protein
VPSLACCDGAAKRAGSIRAGSSRNLVRCSRRSGLGSTSACRMRRRSDYMRTRRDSMGVRKDTAEFTCPSVSRSPASRAVWRRQGLVPNLVPDSGNLTRASALEPPPTRLCIGRNERQGANHNPRVGGSSPSSGIRKALHSVAFVVLGCSTEDESPRRRAARSAQTVDRAPARRSPACRA